MSPPETASHQDTQPNDAEVTMAHGASAEADSVPAKPSNGGDSHESKDTDNSASLPQDDGSSKPLVEVSAEPVLEGQSNTDRPVTPPSNPSKGKQVDRTTDVDQSSESATTTRKSQDNN